MSFGGSTFWIAARSGIRRKEVLAIIVQDWLWVVVSIAIAVIGAFDLSTLGYIMIGVAVLIVGNFACLLGYYLKKPV